MLVGRARELDALRKLRAQAAAGSGAVALVTGEAGIGKTCLLHAVSAEAASEGWSTRVVYHFADSGQPSVLAWFGALGIELGTERLDGPEQRARSFDRVLSVVREQARERPLLLVLEDLHWADQDSLALLLYLIRFALPAPLFLLGSVRLPDRAAAQNRALDELLAELTRSARGEWLTLQPFSADETKAAAEAIAQCVAPQALAELLHRQTQGNPLYVRELMRHICEEGSVQLRDGRMWGEYASAELPLPASIRHVVRQRVSRLAEPTRALLRAASVFAEPCSSELLAQLAQLDAASVLPALDEALAAGLVQAKDTRYELTHALLQRALYEEHSPDRRSQLHRAAAEGLARSPAPDPAQVALHYERSRALPGAAAGVAFALRAAQAASERGAVERAVTLLELATQLLASAADDAQAAFEVWGALAVARAEAVDGAGAQDAAARAQAAALRGGQTEACPALLTAAARALAHAGAPRASFAPLIAEALRGLGDVRDLRWARLQLLQNEPVPLLQGPFWVSHFTGFDGAAIELLRSQGDERDFADSVEPHELRTPEQTRSLRARALSFSDRVARIRVLDACARDSFFSARDFRETARQMTEVRELARRVGSLAGEVSASVVLACTLAVLGDFGEARAYAQRASEIASRLGALHRMNAVGQLAAHSCVEYFLSGELGNYSAQMIDFVSSERAAATPFGIVAVSLGLFGRAHVGDAEGAARIFPVHLSLLERLPVELNEWGSGRDCGASAVFELDARPWAASYLALCERSDERTGSACWSSRAHSTARLLSVLGELERAQEYVEQARADFVQAGRMPCVAICDYDRALMLVRAGHAEHTDVLKYLELAESRFAALGMTSWMERSRQLRNTLRAESAPDPTGLTARELEILRLLAQGHANKAIAAQLFISVPTVERHIANVYAKIGQRGRAAATAYAIRRGLV